MTQRQLVSRTAEVKDVNIFSHYLLVDERLSRWWNEVKMDDSFTSEHGLTPETSKIVSNMIDKKSPAWVDLMNVRKEMKKAVRKFAVPSPFRGYKLVHKSHADYIHSRWQELRPVFDEIFANLLDKYEDEVKAFAKKQPKIYKANKDKYPSRESLSRKFSFIVVLWAMKVPDQGILDPEIRKLTIEQFKRDVAEVKSRTMVYVKDQVLKRMNRIIESFEDGKLNQRTITSANNLLDRIEESFVGLIDSDGLKGVLGQVRKEIGGVDAKLINDDAKYQAELEKKVKKITKNLKKMADKGELAIEI